MCASACPFDAMDLKINGKSIKEDERYPKIKRDIKIYQDKCVLCEQCELVCPQSAIEVERELAERKKFVIGEININKEKCVLCGICAEYCPADAIDLKYHYPTPTNPKPITDIEVDKDKCVFCKVCEFVCPHDAIEVICYKCPMMKKIPQAKLYEDIKGKTVVDKDACVTCGWCAYICPAGAIEVEKPFKGELIIDVNACNACGACVAICPCNALEFPKPKDKAEKVPR